MDASQRMSLNDDIVRLVFERVKSLHHPSALNMLFLSKAVRRASSPSSMAESFWTNTGGLCTLPQLWRSASTSDIMSDASSLGGRASLDQVILTRCTNVNHLAFWIEECNGNLAAFFNLGAFSYPHLTDFSIENIVQYAPRSIPDPISNLQWSRVFQCCPVLTHLLITSQTFSESLAEGNARLIPTLLNPVICILPTTMVLFVVCVNPLPGSSLEVIRRCISQLHQDKRVLSSVREMTSWAGAVALSCFAENCEFASAWGGGPGMGIWEFAEKCVAERDES
ncbi:hypothetical protein BDZ89DRAFT_1163049 [Hymenopellis radicata]|nr:hypothetical protein BDZ89DRAFT_1163049 [Hymenopellis radicata]